MAFYEYQLNPDIRISFSGGPRFLTEIATFRSGKESRNVARDFPLGEWQIEYVQTAALLSSLRSFFMVMRGAGHGFRFKDWADYLATNTEGVLTATGGSNGVGAGVPSYQMKKGYTAAGQTFYRTITKPSGNPAVRRAGGAVNYGASPGQISIDSTLGIITFVADAAPAITGHTPGASHVFTTGTDPGLVIGQKVYLSGITGTAATALNGIAHTISNKSGAGPYTWTISTATTALTASGGTAAKYPQTTDALDWAGAFDCPARFGGDNFEVQFESPTVIRIVGMSVKEIPYP